jgi:hypothetical protein
MAVEMPLANQAEAVQEPSAAFPAARSTGDDSDYERLHGFRYL